MAARDFFQKAFTYRDASDSNRVKPLSGASVTVKIAAATPGTGANAVIYGSRSTSDVTPLANPITLSADGLAEFWAPVGDYDLVFHDNTNPARAADKTFGWAASPTTHASTHSTGGSDQLPEIATINAGLAVRSQFSQGLFSARPGSGTAGRFYYATDRNVLYYDNGSGWLQIQAPNAAKTLMNSNGYTQDGGPFHYSVGASTATQLGVNVNAPAAAITASLSGLYPVEFMYAGFAGTYAGPGSQFSYMQIESPGGNPIASGDGASGTQFSYFNIHEILTATRVAALGAGTWTLRGMGASDGVRTAGWRNVTLLIRERPDLI